MGAYVFEPRARWHREHSLALTMRVSLDGAQERAGTWNQIAYEGEWSGHPAGEFQFTREVFEAIIENFRRREDDVPLTYGHPHPNEGAYMGAAGWLLDLRIGEDDEGRAALYGLMSFNERAAGMIRAGELRYCSVVVAFDSYDERSGDDIGPELLEVGLVLSAFLDGMQPLQLSRAARPAQTNPQTRRAASRGAARKASLMDPAAIRAKLNQLAQLLAISPDDMESDELYGIIFDRIRALLDAGQLAEMLGSEGAEDAPTEDAPAEDAPATAASRALSKLRDSVACALDIDALKGALDELGDDPSPEQVRGAIDEALAAQESDGDDEEPAEKAKAVKPKDDEEDAPVAAMDEPGDPEGAAEEQMAAEALASLADAAGMEMPDLLAAMEERRDELAALLQGAPAEGTGADEAAMMSRARVEAVEARLSAAEKRAERAEAVVDQRDECIARLERELTAQRVDLAIERGQLIEGRPYDRERLVDLAARSPEHFEALMSDGESVPTGKAYGAERPSENRAAAPTTSGEAVKACLAKLAAEKPELSKRELRAQAYERAKAEYPEAFGSRQRG